MIQDEQDWVAAYGELCALIKSKVAEVEFIDFWHDQLLHLNEEDPFPTHSIFLEFNFDQVGTLGMGVQDMIGTVTVYHAFKTLSDTYDQADNQATALAFGGVQRKTHAALQGKSGNNFSSLDRKSGPRRVPVHPLYLCYASTYAVTVRDYSPVPNWSDVTISEVELGSGQAPAPTPLNLFPPIQ